MLPELKAKKGRQPLKAPLSWVEKIELSGESWANERSVGRVSVKYRSSGGEVSNGCWPTCVSVDMLAVSLGWHIGQVSVDISVETRLTYRPRVSTDTRSTDVLSTHDPPCLTLHWHLGWHLNTPSTSQWTVSQESTNFWSTDMSWSRLGQVSTPTVHWDVNGVLTEFLSGCLSSVDWDVSIKCIGQHLNGDTLCTHDPALFQSLKLYWTGLPF